MCGLRISSKRVIGGGSFAWMLYALLSVNLCFDAVVTSGAFAMKKMISVVSISV